MNPFYRYFTTLAALVILAFAPGQASGQCVDEDGPTYILDSLDKCANIHDGAQIRQGVPVNAGTGNLDPFLRVSKGGNGVIVHGINGDGTLKYDEDNSWTNALLLSAISLYFDPDTDTIYRELVLDINQSSDPGVYYPINDLRIYKGASGTLNTTFNAPGIALADHPGMTKIWDLDNGTDPDQRAILLDYDFEAGSGKNPDMILRIPDEEFKGDDYCSYGQSGCTTYIYLYTRHGAVGEVTVPPEGYNSMPELEADNAGFEEWATFVKPFAEVSKTAVADVGEEYDWTVEKTADPDQCSAFAGGECDVDYHITVTKTPYNVEITVSGTITIHVPTIFPVTGATIKTPLVVSEVTDLLGGVEYNGASISCPLGNSFTLDPGDTTVCDYEFTLTPEQYATLTFENSSEAGDYGYPTNMPTNVAIAIGVEEGTGGELIYTPFPSEETPVENGDFYAGPEAILQVDVLDTPEGQSEDDLGDAVATTPGSVEEYIDGIDFDDAIGTFECSSDPADYVLNNGTYYSFDRTNLAEIEDEGNVLDDDDALVTIDCFLPLISKTAVGEYDNLWEWEINKTVSPTVGELFAGQNIFPQYTVELTKSGPVQANHAVTGVISITNPSTDLDLDLDVTLVDVLSDATGGVLESPCDVQPLTIGAGQTLDCNYTASPTDDSAVSNTATATTGDGFDFSDTEPFTWSVTEVNGTVNVTDTNKEDGQQFSDSGTWQYNDIEFACPTAEEEYTDGRWSDNWDNTAEITETTQKSTANFALNCYAPDVEKDALTELDRTYSWDVLKSIADASVEPNRFSVSGDATSLEYHVIAGDEIDSDYTITVSRDSVDSNWHVWGTITVENPAGTPPGAMNVTVSDLITLDGETDVQGVVDCDDQTEGNQVDVVIPAGGSVQCAYDAYLPDGRDRTNTATATLNLSIDEGYPFTFSIPFGFYDEDGNATAAVNRFNETAELADVVVENGDPTGPPSEWDFDFATPLEELTIEYNDPFECSVDENDYSGGTYANNRVNTATLTDKDGTPFVDDTNRDATCYAPDVNKDAYEWIVRTYTWDLEKLVADAEDVGPGAASLTYDVFVNESETATYTITITRDSTDTWFVSGTISLLNPAGSPANMAVDVLDAIPGQLSMYLSCDAEIDTEDPANGNTSIVLEPGVAQECYYFAELPNTDQRLNTATATFEGNPYTGTADVIFDGDTPIVRVNYAIDVDDYYSIDGAPEVETADGPWSFDFNTPEADLFAEYSVQFACSATPADYGDDGKYTTVRGNRAEIRTTDIEDEAEVTLNCYAPVVEKDAETSYDRTWQWTIVKSAMDQENEQAGQSNYDDAILEENWINLQGGNQAFLITYTLEISAVSEESNEAVTGTITVYNPHPSAVMTVDVTDLLPTSSNMTVECEVTGTGVLNVDPLMEGECTYSADLSTALVNLLNTGTATMNGVAFDATADVIFGAPTNEYDRCVDVEDLAGPLGLEVLNLVDSNVCATDEGTGPLGDGETFEPAEDYSYDVQFGGADPGNGTAWIPLEDCIPYEHPNTGRLVGDNDAVVASDDWYIYFNVGCPGCTLTQGYWKTHSELFWGGAPEDPTWNILNNDDGCDPENPENCDYDGDKDFFNGDYSWFDVMVTPPKGGNPFYQLGHQWIAATLNVLAGAYTPEDVEEALTLGGALLEKYSADPSSVLGGKGKGKKSASDELLQDAADMGAYASLLASYNEGDIGPGHCDDDGTTEQALSRVAGSIDQALDLEAETAIDELTVDEVTENGEGLQIAAQEAGEVEIRSTQEGAESETPEADPAVAGATPTKSAPAETAETESAGERTTASDVDDGGVKVKGGVDSPDEIVYDEDQPYQGSKGDVDDVNVRAKEGVASQAARVEIPSDFAIGNYPNPFNPTTTIRFAVPEASHVRVAVYDLLGRMVQSLVDGQVSAGTHNVTFDAGSLPSGVYLYRFEYDGGAITKTMQLLK